MKISPVAAVLFHADRWTDRWMDRHTYQSKYWLFEILSISTNALKLAIT
jgi:hypothetical protein